ncbi:MAG: mraW [Deltaproteobacteria bacterium]|nr:mraW [Deltaproteobacteria bacterium]
MSGREHISVLFQEALDNLISTESGIFVDATVGAAGHALGLLGRNRKLHLIGIDRDQEALERAHEVLEAYSDRVTLLRGNFGDMKALLQSVGVKSIDGALFDLGISSYQLESGRGFSFNDDEELDMRMDRKQDLTAYDIVNSYRQDEMARILYEYGEEWQSRRIAKAIFENRKKARIRTGRQLADIIASVKKRTGKIHPATKTFQALRIAVNDELRSLVKGMDGAIELLSSGSRIGVIAFHSLEDRIVKERFRNDEALTVVTRKPVRPGLDEIRSNPRSRSAKLRIAQKN